MELDGKKIPFTSVKPILELMNMSKQGIPIPAEPLVTYLKKFDETGQCHGFKKKFHNLQEFRYGDNFEEVTDLDIEGQPFTVTLMEFPEHKIWYWVSGRQDVRLAGLGMKFLDPIEIWVSEMAKESWYGKSVEERNQNQENDIIKIMQLLDGFAQRPESYKVTFHYIVDFIKLAMHEHLAKEGYFDDK